MIDTIFYFCPTLALYEQTLEENGGEGISSKTITFVEDVREIYFNGRGYGKTSTAGLLSEDEFNAWKNAILGRLGALDDKQSEHDNTFNDVYSKFAEALSDIDDINEYIENLLSQIGNTNAKLQEEIDGLSDKIDAEVLAQLEDADSLINQALDGKMETAIGDGLGAYQGFVTTDNATWADLVLTYNNVKSTVNLVGYLLDADGNIKYTSAIQSLIDQGIDNNQAFLNLSTKYAWLDDDENVIKWMVSGFRSRTGEASSFAELFAASQSGIDADALASLKAEILEDADGRYVAEGDFSTRVSGFLTSDDLNGYALVESLSSLALKSTMEEASASLMASYGINNKTTIAGINATANENWARISAITSRDGNNAVIFNLSMLDSAVAGLIVDTNSTSYAKIQAATTTDQAGVDITTIVNNAMSSYALTTYVDAAETRIRNYLTDGSGNVITSSSLQSQVDRNAAKLNAIANWNGWSDGQPVNYTSEWVLHSDLEGSVAGFIASGNNNLKAAITAYVNSSDSGITLSAENINLDGNVIASSLTTDNATIGGFKIYNGYLWAESGNNRLQLSPTTGITFSTVGENTSSTQFSMDGSGHLAKGNISWTTAGAVTMTNASVTGSITATDGTIGGFIINQTSLGSLDSSNALTLSRTGGIIAGSSEKYWELTPNGRVELPGYFSSNHPGFMYKTYDSDSDSMITRLTLAVSSNSNTPYLYFNQSETYLSSTSLYIKSGDSTFSINTNDGFKITRNNITLSATVDTGLGKAYFRSDSWLSYSDINNSNRYWNGYVYANGNGRLTVDCDGSRKFILSVYNTSSALDLPTDPAKGLVQLFRIYGGNTTVNGNGKKILTSSGSQVDTYDTGGKPTIFVYDGNWWVLFVCN